MYKHYRVCDICGKVVDLNEPTLFDPSFLKATIKVEFDPPKYPREKELDLCEDCHIKIFGKGDSK